MLIATASVSASKFLGLARPWESRDEESPKVESVLSTAVQGTQPVSPLPDPSDAPFVIRKDCDVLADAQTRNLAERLWFQVSCARDEQQSQQLPTTPTQARQPGLQDVQPVLVSTQAPPPTLSIQPPPQTPAPPAPTKGPEQPPVQQLADFWNTYDRTWAEGSLVETQIAIFSLTGADTSYLDSQYQSLRQFALDCVGVGTLVASVPGSQQLCSQMLAGGSLYTVQIQVAQLAGAGTYFLNLAKSEVDAFIATAGC